MSEKKSKEARTRNYATVVYPESAPENWKQLLEDFKIPCFISPLHDKDINPTGEPKKPHYHVMLMFEGVKTKLQAIEVFSAFGGVGCEVINSIRGYARYLCHLDNPEKAQYDPYKVQQFGGASYMDSIGTMADKAKAIREMIDFISKNDFRYFNKFLDWCSINQSEWFDCLLNSGAYVIREYIKSYSYMKDREEQTDIRTANNHLQAENIMLRQQLESLHNMLKKKEGV